MGCQLIDQLRTHSYSRVYPLDIFIYAAHLTLSRESYKYEPFDLAFQFLNSLSMIMGLIHSVIQVSHFVYLLSLVSRSTPIKSRAPKYFHRLCFNPSIDQVSEARNITA